MTVLKDGNIKNKIAFDEVQTSYYQNTMGNNKLKIIARKGKKWGLIQAVSGNTIYLSRNFLYNSPKEVPSARVFPESQLQMVERLREKYNVDLIESLDWYGFYLKARDEKTQLWGMFMGEGEVISETPMQYDNIIRHGRAEVYEVHKNGKVGYCNSQFKLVKNTEFDDFQIVRLLRGYACVLQKNGFWQFYNCNDGKLLFEEKVKSLEEYDPGWLYKY